MKQLGLRTYCLTLQGWVSGRIEDVGREEAFSVLSQKSCWEK